MTPHDGITGKVSDYLTTRLAFRVWRIDTRRGVLLSVNAGRPVKRNTWFLPNAISSPEGEWHKGDLMLARCARERDHDAGVPDPDCSCGIYATTDLEIVNDYLTDVSPVLGVVELGGRTIPATQGYRAQAARVAAVLLVEEMFTLRHAALETIAKEYGVPALVPHTTEAEEFRPLLGQDPGAIDWDAELNRLLGESGR